MPRPSPRLPLESSPQLFLAPAPAKEPAPSRAPREPRSRREPQPLGVVAQVRAAFRARNRLPALLGFLLGGFVPVACYVLAHAELTGAPVWTQPRAVLVLGGLLFSLRTVYAWGRLAFAESAKALGFCVLVEGVMVTAQTEWLAFAALAYLVAINGIATGCRLALDGRSNPELDA